MEPTHRYNLHFPITRYERLRKLSYKTKRDISEIVNQFTEEGLQNSEELEVMIKPISIGITFHNRMVESQQQQEQPITEEEKLILATKNLNAAIDQMLPYMTSSKMNLDTYQKLKYNTIDRMARIRNPKFEKEELSKAMKRTPSIVDRVLDNVSTKITNNIRDSKANEEPTTITK